MHAIAVVGRLVEVLCSAARKVAALVTAEFFALVDTGAAVSFVASFAGVAFPFDEV